MAPSFTIKTKSRFSIFFFYFILFLQLDIVVEDDTFVHFYHGPAKEMESIPTHVLFIFDSSMSQDKLTMGKEAFATLMNSLTENDLFNLALFNGNYGKRSVQWNRETENEIVQDDTVPTIPFLSTEENKLKAIEFVNNMETSGWNSTTNNIVEAINDNVALAAALSEAGSLPANAFSRIVLLTDGRMISSEAESEMETKSTFLPLTIIGIGILIFCKNAFQPCLQINVL